MFNPAGLRQGSISPQESGCLGIHWVLIALGDVVLKAQCAQRFATGIILIVRG